MSGKTRGPWVHRAPARATWEFDHRWGTLIGDSTALRVTRTDGGAMTVAYGSESLEVRAELVTHFAEMVAAAAAWTDARSADA